MFFFFNDTAPTEIYTLSLHDALPIWIEERNPALNAVVETFPDHSRQMLQDAPEGPLHGVPRSEEHTSELQSRQYLVCRLLLEKKKNVHDKDSLTVSKSRTKSTHYIIF